MPGGKSGRGWQFALRLSESLAPLLLAVAVLIPGRGPQQLGEPKSERQLTNIEFCVDVSGSMTAKFGEGTRYETSMKAIDDFLTQRAGDAFGLTFFANNVIQWVPLTSDPSALRCAPPFMNPADGPPWMMGTMVGMALRECKKTLRERSDGDRMIVPGDRRVLIRPGQRQRRDDCPGVEGRGDHRVHHPRRRDRGLVGDGHDRADHWRRGLLPLATPEGLKSVFSRIDTMKQVKLKKTIAETQDNFGPYCLAGLGTLGTLALAGLGVRYTPW